MTRRRIINAALAILIPLGALIGIATIAGWAYIVLHFVIKFW